MATYKVVDAEQLDADLTGLADAIREKGGTSAELTWPAGFQQAVEDIPSGVELPVLTNPGDAAKLLEGYQLIDGDGNVVEGEIEEVELSTPGLAMNADGSVVAYVDQPAGYTAGGYKTYKRSQDVVAAQTIMPGTEDQVIPAYRYLTGKQTIKGDANLTSDYLYEDQTLFGVSGEKPLPEAVLPQPDSLTLDPDVVYVTTRPKDWLPMPTPGDDEIYILCHIIDGLTETIRFRVYGSSDCVVELGTVVEGAFVAQETFSSVTGTEFVKTLDSADYGNLTSDGRKQCMVRVKGGVTTFNGVTSIGPHPGVEVVCGIDLTGVQFGYVADTARCWKDLQYVSFVGNGGAKSFNQAFYYCASLKCIRCEKENIVTDLRSAFRDCYSLIALSNNIVGGSDGAVSANYLFQNTTLQKVSEFKATLSSANMMFASSKLSRIDMASIDTSAAGDFGGFCRYGYSFAEVLNINISALTTTSFMFTHMYNLRRLTFAGETTPGGVTIEVGNATGMGHAALVETLNSLPVATAAATLTISSAPGAAELTEDEIAVATAKNWTITI